MTWFDPMMDMALVSGQDEDFSPIPSFLPEDGQFDPMMDMALASGQDVDFSPTPSFLPEDGQLDPEMEMVLASGHSCCPKFQKFLWQHWDYPKTGVYPYCDVMMWKKGLYGKLKHIFIHAPIKKIINICHGEGIYLGNGWFKSKRFFYITRCTFNCKTGHYTGFCMSTRIIIKCKCGFPVAIKE